MYQLVMDKGANLTGAAGAYAPPLFWSRKYPKLLASTTTFQFRLAPLVMDQAFPKLWVFGFWRCPRVMSWMLHYIFCRIFAIFDDFQKQSTPAEGRHTTELCKIIIKNWQKNEEKSCSTCIQPTQFALISGRKNPISDRDQVYHHQSITMADYQQKILFTSLDGGVS